jgi:hypothetical protein
MSSLVELMQRLRRLPKYERERLKLDVEDLAEGFRQLRENAPRRLQPFHAPTRSGLNGAPTRRLEEYLASTLWRGGDIALPDGERLRLLDYQTPLKSRRADKGVGKVDLLGVDAHGILAVVELKIRGDSEDRRVGLLEGLIYAAIVEANVAKISDEFGRARGARISPVRPRVLVVAPAKYWDDDRAYPAASEIAALARAVGSAVPIDVKLLRLCDAEQRDWNASDLTTLESGACLLPVGEGSEQQRHSLAAETQHQSEYLTALLRTFWSYRRSAFADNDECFESHRVEPMDPVVFRHEYVNRNLIFPPSASPHVASAIEAMIPPSERHLHFGSMRSSQALAQSVFAGLGALNRLDVLAGLLAEGGSLAFFESAAGYKMELEHKVSNLHETSATSIDAFFLGPTKVAVEVKFAEYEFGPCSRPALPADDRFHCDGNYMVQGTRKERCSLSESRKRPPV